MPDFAARKRIDRHPDLEKDFVYLILELPWAFISDDSSIWDFHTDLTNDAFVGKIHAIYGDDVSDIPRGNIADILDLIARKSR
jgi:hypothetical protein